MYHSTCCVSIFFANLCYILQANFWKQKRLRFICKHQGRVSMTRLPTGKLEFAKLGQMFIDADESTAK